MVIVLFLSNQFYLRYLLCNRHSMIGGGGGCNHNSIIIAVTNKKKYKINFQVMNKIKHGESEITDSTPKCVSVSIGYDARYWIFELRRIGNNNSAITLDRY